MTRLTRRIIFYIAIFLFLSVGYVAVLYAQGYKYDFEEGEFLKTGVFYLKSNTSAEVYVDGEFAGKTSFLTSSFSQDRLLPGQYTVQVKKDGYSTWQKNIGVDEGMVTDFPRVMILPIDGEDANDLIVEIETLFLPLVTPIPSPIKKSPQPTPMIIKSGDYQMLNKTLIDARIEDQPKILATNVLGFSLSEDKSKIVWWDDRQVWLMHLKDQDYQPYMKTGERDLVLRLNKTIKNAAWFRDSDHVVLDMGSVASGSTVKHEYQIVEIDRRGGQNVIKI